MRRRTVGQVAIERVGFLKARQALMFIACWWIATADLGRNPETVDEYGEWWLMSRSQAFREQQTFRRAFPEYATPTELATALGYDFTALKRDQANEVMVDLVALAVP
jgi:hypothetical protein